MEEEGEGEISSNKSSFFEDVLLLFVNFLSNLLVILWNNWGSRDNRASNWYDNSSIADRLIGVVVVAVFPAAVAAAVVVVEAAALDGEIWASGVCAAGVLVVGEEGAEGEVVVVVVVVKEGVGAGAV